MLRYCQFTSLHIYIFIICVHIIWIFVYIKTGLFVDIVYALHKKCSLGYVLLPGTHACWTQALLRSVYTSSISWLVSYKKRYFARNVEHVLLLLDKTLRIIKPNIVSAYVTKYFKTNQSYNCHL